MGSPPQNPTTGFGRHFHMPARALIVRAVFHPVWRLNLRPGFIPNVYLAFPLVASILPTGTKYVTCENPTLLRLKISNIDGNFVDKSEAATVTYSSKSREEVRHGYSGDQLEG